MQTKLSHLRVQHLWRESQSGHPSEWGGALPLMDGICQVNMMMPPNSRYTRECRNCSSWVCVCVWGGSKVSWLKWQLCGLDCGWCAEAQLSVQRTCPLKGVITIEKNHMDTLICTPADLAGIVEQKDREIAVLAFWFLQLAGCKRKSAN